MNDKGDYETRAEWHRVYTWGKLSKFASKIEKGQFTPKSTPPASSGFQT